MLPGVRGSAVDVAGFVGSLFLAANRGSLYLSQRNQALRLLVMKYTKLMAALFGTATIFALHDT